MRQMAESAAEKMASPISEDFPGGVISIKRRLDGEVRIEFGREVIVVSAENAVAIAEALLKEAGARMHIVRSS